jgi:glucose-6-phosphate dehydrogenase assembly protein OpcA
MAHAMTDIVTENVATWTGEHVAIADVVKAVEDLRRSEQKAATRTSIATLIIVTRTEDELAAAEEVIDQIGVRHPARIITLMVPRGADEGEDRVDAEVTLHAGNASGHRIWSDELRLKVSGGPSRHLASLLRPLQLSDLPVVVWYVNGLPDVGDPLLKLANAVIVDTKTGADPGQGEMAMLQVFKEVVRLSRKHTIIDLSWNRLRPWRALTSSLFSGDMFRPFVNNVSRVEVSGKLGPRMLLAGWLASRLYLERNVIHLYDERHVSLRMDSNVHDIHGDFLVERVPDERLVRSAGSIDGGPSHNELFALPSVALPDSLFEALRNLERDRIYEQAIKTITGWDFSPVSSSSSTSSAEGAGE